MTPSDQALLLLRKAAQDQAALEKLVSKLAFGGHNYPRSHNIGLLLDLQEANGAFPAAARLDRLKGPLAADVAMASRPRHQLPAPACRSGRHLARVSLCGAAAGLALSTVGAEAARASCRFLMPIGGSGQPVVTKRIGSDRLVGRTNWNTDFIVDRAFASYRFNFESASTARATFPVAGFMRFTDGTSLQVFNENPTLNPGERRSFGPFAAVPGKRSNQMNFRVGSSLMPAATGFSYRISVEGCQ